MSTPPNKNVETQHVVHHINLQQNTQQNTQQTTQQNPPSGTTADVVVENSLLSKIKNMIPSTKWIIVIVISTFTLLFLKSFFSKKPELPKVEKDKVPLLKKDSDYYSTMNNRTVKKKEATPPSKPPKEIIEEDDCKEEDDDVEIVPPQVTKNEPLTRNSRLIKEFEQKDLPTDIILEEDEEDDDDEELVDDDDE